MHALTPTQRRIHQAALRLFTVKGIAQVNISDLAQEASVARGTVYKNVESIEKLFAEVASQLSAEMHQRVKKAIEGIPDPAQRLANGIRLFIRRAHEEPQWGAFMTRFAMSSAALREMFYSQATVDVLDGLNSKRYQFQQEQLLSVISLIASSTLGSMFLVMEGHRTWRDAGSDTAELVLRGLGIAPDEARALSTGDIPTLPAQD
ncbi:TetR/AcrR family transcriptional regulator [Pseudomonas yamanorum]|uniref:TetR/AcrR family transcriptional regulator n=1 Tax=Pseudomonas yamanorum TaxID=515393 RepID=UPI001C437777|nr:TetR/AcrR family transcriptional regulator [Pseudomonas yamanorum]